MNKIKSLLLTGLLLTSSNAFAETSLLRSDFGMSAYIPLVGDKIDIEIYVEFQKS